MNTVETHVALGARKEHSYGQIVVCVPPRVEDTEGRRRCPIAKKEVATETIWHQTCDDAQRLNMIYLRPQKGQVIVPNAMQTNRETGKRGLRQPSLCNSVSKPLLSKTHFHQSINYSYRASH